MLIKYCNNPLPNIDQFIWSKIAQLPVYWHASSQLVNQSLKRKAIGWFKHTGSWSIFQQMNWSVIINELMRYFINTSIATTVKMPLENVFFHRLELRVKLFTYCLSIEIILIWDSNLSRLNQDGATRVYISIKLW